MNNIMLDKIKELETKNDLLRDKNDFLENEVVALNQIILRLVEQEKNTTHLMTELKKEIIREKILW